MSPRRQEKALLNKLRVAIRATARVKTADAFLARLETNLGLVEDVIDVLAFTKTKSIERNLARARRAISKAKRAIR